ncbi:hypothetical protein AB0C07_08475 [Actinoplanes missouriensis]|uniref:hypothetical protein n=1 Tax=Actinoplanes missouriensis TaxID=1866 RepID=UPI0034106074
MNDFGQQFREMVVSGSSPDGNVQATVTGERILRVVFRAGSYEWYGEAALERQLAGLAATTWVAWVRERREISRRASGLSREEARKSNSSEYEEAARMIEFVGASFDQSVQIRTTGMTHWDVRIAGGTLRRVDARGFAEIVREAFEDVLRDRESKLILLKADHFDIGIPQSWRDRTRDM